MSIQVRSNETPPAQAPEAKAESAEVKEDQASDKSAPEANASEQKEPSESETEEAGEEKGESTDSADHEDGEPESKDETDEKTKKPSGIQRRVNKLNAKIAAKEQEAEYWKQQALAANASKAEPKTEAKQATASTEGKPNAEDFDSHADYVEALTDWKTEQKFAARDQKLEQTKLQNEQARLSQTYAERKKAFAEKTEDFDEMMENLADVPRTPALESLILSAENGPEILYELAKNPKEAKRIASLPPLMVARELGKFEARLASSSPAETKQETKKPSNAPKPLAPVGAGSGSAKKSITDLNLSQAEYERLRREQLKKKPA